MLAYGAISDSDECIHTEQLRYISRILKRQKVVQEMVNAVFLDEEHISGPSKAKVPSRWEAIQLMQVEPAYVIYWFQRKLVKLLCLDGAYDDGERRFLEEVFPGYCPSKYLIKSSLKSFRRIAGNGRIKALVRYGVRLVRRCGLRLLGRTDNSLRLPDGRYRLPARQEFSLFVSNIQCRFTEFVEMLERNSREGENQDIAVGFLDSVKTVLHSGRMWDMAQEPTVALVGRTKAGKSSLFYLISGCGKEFIGKGGQRMTRFAAATHLYGIRIIDTPGLSASEDVLNKDAERTIHILKKADFVCLILGDDTINEDTRQHICQIAKMNLPFSVMMNYKNGEVARADGLSKYLESPEKWKQEELDGWKEYLSGFAKSCYFDHILKFHDLYILAAKIGTEGKIEEKAQDGTRTFKKLLRKERSTLLESSNYPTVINDLLERVCKNYPLYQAGVVFQEVFSTYCELKKYISKKEKYISDAKQAEEKKRDAILKIIEEYNIHTVQCVYELFDNGCMELIEEFQTKEFSLQQKKFVQEVMEMLDKASREWITKANQILEKAYREFLEAIEPYDPPLVCKSPVVCSETIADNLSFNSKCNVVTMREILIIPSIIFSFAKGPTKKVAAFASGSVNSTRKKMPSYGQRKSSLDMERQKEFQEHIKKYCCMKKSAVKDEVDAHSRSIREVVQKQFQMKRQRLDKKIDCLERYADSIELLKKTIETEYASFFLQVRQPKARMCFADFCMESDVPVFQIYADFCEPEIWEETYITVKISRR